MQREPLTPFTEADVHEMLDTPIGTYQRGRTFCKQCDCPNSHCLVYCYKCGCKEFNDGSTWTIYNTIQRVKKFYPETSWLPAMMAYYIEKKYNVLCFDAYRSICNHTEEKNKLNQWYFSYKALHP